MHLVKYYFVHLLMMLCLVQMTLFNFLLVSLCSIWWSKQMHSISSFKPFSNSFREVTNSLNHNMILFYLFISLSFAMILLFISSFNVFTIWLSCWFHSPLPWSSFSSHCPLLLIPSMLLWCCLIVDFVVLCNDPPLHLIVLCCHHFFHLAVLHCQQFSHLCVVGH